jgi:membrane protein
MVSLAAVRSRADDIQQSRRWLAFPYAVVKKFGEDSSGNLAVLLTYYAFFSLFPLLIALFSVLAFVLKDHPDWQLTIHQDAVANLPFLSSKHHPGAIETPAPISGSLAVIVVGVLLALYSGLGIGKTAQTVGDVVYGVPRPDRPGFLAKNLHALRLVIVGGLGLLATTAVSTSVAAGTLFGVNLPTGLELLSVVVTVALNTLVFATVFRWSTIRRVTFREALPGAVLCAASFAILQALVQVFIAHKLNSASATYGALATVIVLLSWFYVQAQVFVLSQQVNVVKQDRLWPRSLNEDPATTATADSAADDPAPT